MARRDATRYLILAAVCLLIGGCLAVRWHYGNRYAVRMENLGKIAVGMPAAEVERLLGRREDHSVILARTLVKGETLEAEGESFTGPCEVRLRVVDWQVAGGPFVRIVYDADDRVLSKRLAPGGHGPAVDFFRRVRGWLLGF
jgi:hypothetical protein